jgi:hypothetical protein
MQCGHRDVGQATEDCLLLPDKHAAARLAAGGDPGGSFAARLSAKAQQCGNGRGVLLDCRPDSERRRLGRALCYPLRS